MLKSFAGVGAAALIALGVALGGSPASAESVMKQCGDQWQAAKAAGTTNGETWPQFLSQCRAQLKTGAAAPAPAAPAPAAPAPAPVANARRDDEDRKPVRRGIRGEQGRDQSLRADEARVCRRLPRGQRDDPAGDRRSSCAPAPAPAQNTGSLFPWQQPAAPAPTATAAPTGAGQFASEQQAKYRCPSDTVVWVNTNSGVYHFAGTHNYGQRSRALTCARLMRKLRAIGRPRTRSTREALKAAHATHCRRHSRSAMARTISEHARR